MKSIFTIVIFLTGSLAFGQQDWTRLVSKSGVDVSYKVIHCDLNAGFAQELYLLRFENTRKQDVTMEWDIHLWYNDECKTCDDPGGEYHRDLSLASGEVVEGTCVIGSDNRLYLFSRFDDPAYNGRDVHLTDFKLANLKVDTR